MEYLYGCIIVYFSNVLVFLLHICLIKKRLKHILGNISLRSDEACRGIILDQRVSHATVDSVCPNLSHVSQYPDTIYLKYPRYLQSAICVSHETVDPCLPISTHRQILARINQQDNIRQWANINHPILAYKYKNAKQHCPKRHP